MTDMRWQPDAPPFRSHVVVAAPHPDDEVLGCAGMMAWLVEAGHDVRIVAVTDGAASHAESSRIEPAELIACRALERARALARLGLADVRTNRLGFPDAGVRDHEDELAGALVPELDRETTLVVPWRHDGHPDHEAVARAGRRAAADAGASCCEVPIWARVRGRRCRPRHRLELGTFRERKCVAVGEFRSQLVALGPDPVDGPVVHAAELRALTSGSEWVVSVT